MNQSCYKSPARLTSMLICCFAVLSVCSQPVSQGKNNFPLYIDFTGKDSSFHPQDLKLQYRFDGQSEAVTYINRLPALMQGKGFLSASVDSLHVSDSAAYITLFTGKIYKWIQVVPKNIDQKALLQSGYIEKDFNNKPMDFNRLQIIQQRLLNYFDNNGYPFASVFLDSISLSGNQVKALLVADRGLLYKIDSTRLFGKVKINRFFLQRYLNIPDGSYYSKEKLQQVDKRMLELSFITPEQPSDITMLGSGAILNLYAKPRRSSRADFLVGFLPSANNTGKLQLTADVNLDLKNLMGSGEALLLKWQQLQPKSPRLNIGFNKPYIFRSSFGIDMLFDLFKKDSSFLQINGQLGLQYVLSAAQSGKIFMQWQSNSLLPGGIDTIFIKSQKKLPVNIDVRSVNVGLNYDWNSTDYRYNPRHGNEVNVVASVGVKNIQRNNDVLNLADPNFNYASLYDSIKLRSYQLRLKTTAAHYFSLGKYAVLKTALNGGLYNSPEIFRNELFQIGGYRLMRGFDEESIYATRYAVATAEWRYLISLNSYLFFFTDAGLVQNRYQDIRVNNQFFSGGLGLVYETKAGLLNISYALGKRDDVRFNLREASKMHFGYISYF